VADSIRIDEARRYGGCDVVRRPLGLQQKRYALLQPRRRKYGHDRA
jgi:hypothetical protein